MLCRRCAILALFFLALCACPEAQRTPPAEAEAADEESGDANGAASYDAPALTVEREEALPKQPPLAHSDDDPPATVMHAHETTTKTPPHSSGSPPSSSLQVLLILLALLSSMLTISRHQ